MKKKCKNIDITDQKMVLPWVADCVMRHKSRYDFKKLLLKHGLDEKDYYTALQTYDYSVLMKPIESIAKNACESIIRRNLDLPPVSIKRRMDTTTGKIRDIGRESAMQQVFDYIAVYSAMDIFKSRLVEQQMSSIPGRGQIKGMKLIRKYSRKDYKAMKYAKRHDLSYTSICKYHVKLDIHQCYPSADSEIFMKLFEHDCGNEDIIWLWRKLLDLHHIDGYTGFMIGALPSQWACQFMISFIYRKAMELYYYRRGKKYNNISHMVLFMDDMVLFGSNRKKLLSAVRSLMKYVKAELGFNIKKNFAIHQFDNTPVDMMGFVIYRNGKVEMRERNFIKSRRLIWRFQKIGKMAVSQAKRLVSYKGYYKYSDSHKISKELYAFKVFSICQSIISKDDKEKNNAKNLLFRGANPDCLFPAG